MSRIKTVEIVSLSSGTVGEAFAAHELKSGVRRLEEMGLRVRFAANALKGIDHLQNHPEDRASDLIEAYSDPEVDMILCAIGGDDTYRLLPYLFEEDRLKKVVNDKVFLGFSDTTMNHFMLHKLGISTFYGQSFLSDVCELETEMLPYTCRYFRELITTGTIREIRPSDVWYEERTDFGESQIGVPRKKHPNSGFELLQGRAVFSGKILGGCIDSIYDIFDPDRYEDSVSLCARYGLFPPKEDWAGRILLLESSEEKPAPERYEKMLLVLKEAGVFDVVSGVLVGKPMDETYADEYKRLLVKVINDPDLPILWNINIGHATPRCIIPFGVPARVDANKQVITFDASSKRYRFYGAETADIRDKNGRTPRDYYDLLTKIWSADTCAPRLRGEWSEGNRTLGQCSVTAFLMQDLFGGKVYGIPRGDGNFHCFNDVDGCVFDLTSEQFGDEELDYSDCPEQFREVHFQKEEKRKRYELLKERLDQA